MARSGSKKGDSRRGNPAPSQAGFSKSDPSDDKQPKSSEENTTNDSAPGGNTAMEDEHLRTAEPAEEPRNDRQREKKTLDLARPENDARDKDADDFHGSQDRIENCSVRSTDDEPQPARARPASPKNPPPYAVDQNSGSSRRDLGLEDGGNGGSHGLSNYFGPGSLPRTATTPYPSQSHRTMDYQANGGHLESSRNDYDSQPNWAARSENRMQSTASKQLSDAGPAARSTTYQDTSKPKGEPSDFTTLRIKRLGADYLQQINDDPRHWQHYFKLFRNDMIDEIKKSQNQMSALSAEMLAGRDRYQPTPDGEFEALMNQLREDVKMLGRDLVSAVKDAKLQHTELREILEDKILSKVFDDSLWEKASSRKFFMQSAIWKILKDRLFHSPFLVFGNEGSHLGETWNVLFADMTPQGHPEKYDTPAPTVLSERWKSLTGTRLEEKYGKDVASYRINALDGLESLMDAISEKILPYTAPASWGPNLKKALNNAARLAIMMAKQRSRFEVYIPQIRSSGHVRSDGGQHEIIGKVIDIEEELQNIVPDDIGFVVIPGLRRWGDSLGTRLDNSVDLEAAQLKCVEQEV